MNKIIIAIVALVVIVGGGFLLLSGSQNQTTTSTTPSTTTAPTEASPTEEPSSMTAEEEHEITLSDDGYSPANLTIKVGEKVTWTNNSGAAATVSSDPHPNHTNYPPLNLGQFTDGGSLSLVFDKAGTYGYHNHFDASQKGTITVE